jgi:hypothetical protein
MIVAAFLAQILLAAKGAWLARDELNPDGLVYLRIAGYYINGQTDLMVAGGWGPLLSWLMVPWLLVFPDDPVLAAHAAMACSAVVFLFGSYSLLRAMKLPYEAVVCGTWLTALISATWSARVITPDLLMDGIFCYGISRLLEGKWTLGSGLILGAAYLTKHIALPLTVLVAVVLAVVYRPRLRAAGCFVAGLMLMALPWIGLVSYHYGHPTFSTIGPIQHALMGPPDRFRDHPDHRHFYKPEPGRVTVLEDRANLPYNYWSPLESWEYAEHQARVMFQNVRYMVYYFRHTDWLGLGFLSAVCGFLGVSWRRKWKN